MSQPEVWLRGPVKGVADELQPVAHALIQAREDLDLLLERVPAAEMWATPGGAASAGFHVRHLVGSLDRLMTYARGESLADHQVDALRAEHLPDPGMTSGDLRASVTTAIERALKQVRETDAATLGEMRAVGRARIPATVRGILFHAAEHTTRHVGQVSTTLKVVRG
jgi:hypothetical protein